MNHRAFALALAAFVCCLLYSVASVHSADTLESVRALSDVDLLKTYESEALAAGATDARLASNPRNFNRRVEPARVEILRRGAAIVPKLCELLRGEISTHRLAPPGSSVEPGLIDDEIALLVEIGDPGAVKPLLDLASAPQPGHFPPTASKEISAIEKLTFVCFHRLRPHVDNYAAAVQHPNALQVDSYSSLDLPNVVQLYRDWLNGEGHDPAAWLPIAQKRARASLQGDDLNAVYCALAFLSGGNRGRAGFPHDDDPMRTLARIGDILAGSTHVTNGDKFDYQYKSMPLPESLYNWVFYLTQHGASARPWARELIRFQNETGLNNWTGFSEMEKVGGSEILTYCFDSLPKINLQVEALNKDPATPKGFGSQDPRGWWFDAQRQCRWAIDRWAGQSFDTDDLRLAWWNANRDKSSEQWLKDSLPVAVERASTKTQGYNARLFHELLPDAPYAANDIPFPISQITTPRIPSRAGYQTWYQEHRAALKYDPSSGSFRLANAPPR